MLKCPFWPPHSYIITIAADVSLLIAADAGTGRSAIHILYSVMISTAAHAGTGRSAAQMLYSV
jgi:hypothetical protein